MRQIIVCISLAVAVMATGLSPIPADASLVPICVSTSGNDANTGFGWDVAKRTVQAALNAATTANEVWVAAGTYVERITLKAGVGLYGGFAGTETDRSQRNWATNVTILDGNQGGSVVSTPSGAIATTRIDGFTIRNGKAASYGGGIYCPSWATIANNVIIGNSAGSDGGGIHCDYNPTIVNNTIIGNSTGSSGHGGGICSLSTSSPTIVNNTIIANTAKYGGGICSWGYSPTIANTLIAFNSSGYYYYYGYSGSWPKLRSNCVYGNTDYNYAGVTNPTGTNGNISANPLLMRLANPGLDGLWGTSDDDQGDLRLQFSSPCIDAGGNADVPADAADLDNDGNTTEPMPFDLAGRNRFIDDPDTADTGVGTAPIVDIGAHEGPVTDLVAPPAFSPDGGAYVSDQQVVITGTTPNAVIHYTTNGLDPTESDPSIASGGSVAVTIEPATTLKAKAFRTGWGPSDIKAAQYRRIVPILVSTSGNDANDGLTWGTAKRTVQAALNAATTANEVWVAAGTYVERITLKAGASLYGGFAGTETDRSQRDWVANLTILDGNQGGNVITAASHETAATRIDGFTIRNGKTSYGSIGISCSSSSPTIANNTITANYQGIYCYASCAMIVGNTITANGSAGIYCSTTSLTITNNTIAGNANHGIDCSSSSLVITGNTITDNRTSGSGGGIYSALASSLSLANNTITANRATNEGGGICSSSPTTIVNTIVAFNSSGIYCTSGPTAKNTCVYGNAAYDYRGMADPTGAMGNISANPLFLRPANAGLDGVWGTSDDDYGDLRLQFGSPCIDAGRNASVPADVADLDGDGNTTEPTPLDREGRNRFIDDPDTADTGVGTAPIVDMGAYEGPTERVAPPAFSPDGAGYDSDQQVVITCTTPNAIIHYTTNGVDPTESDPSIASGGSVAVTIEPATTLKAQAFLTGWSPSDIKAALYRKGRPVFVSTSGNDTNDGFSWDTAKRSVGACLNAAGAGDEVWVAAGTYVERITLKPGVSLYGGFTGTEENRSERTLAANATILDGNQGGTVVTLSAGGTAAIRIDGFTIRNGRWSGGIGGGISCTGSSLILVDCRIEHNYGATYYSGSRSDGVPGGGVYCSNSSLQMIRCVVRDNMAGYGASGGPGAGNGYPGMNGGDGGGLYLSDGTALLIDCVIAGNYGGSGGGGGPGEISAGRGGDGGNGGGIYNLGSTLTLINCVVTRNRGGLGGPGGCLVMTQDCAADGADGTGGGVLGGATIRNSIIWANQGSQASGSAVSYSDIQGGMSGTGNISSDPLFVNAANGDFRLGAGSPCIDAGDNSAVPADSLDVDGDGNTTEPFPTDLIGIARFIDDPQVSDTGLGTAPIVDMGAYEVFTDCNSNGVPDSLDPDADSDGIPDACDSCPGTIAGATINGNGCPPAIPGDFDHDGDVDSADLEVFKDCVSGPGVGHVSGCDAADFDDDNDVDQEDFGVVQRCYSGENHPADPNCGN